MADQAPDNAATPVETTPPAEAPTDTKVETPPKTPAQTDDEIYDQAFNEFMVDGAGEAETADQGTGDEATPAQTGSEAPPADADASATPHRLTDDQVQLLRRSHMTPEQLASWTPEQVTDFLDNAAKREADNTTTYKTLHEEVKGLRELVEQGNAGNQEGDADDPAATAAGEFEQQAVAMVDKAAEVYGDEFKDSIGTITTSLGKQVDTLTGQLEASQNSANMLGGLVVEMVIDSSVRDLAGDFPSLSKAEARQKVIDRFKDDWKTRDQSGDKRPMLERVKSAMKDAANAEFGTVTESAAQASLVNKAKQRLSQQPPDGSSKAAHKVALTEDQVYDNAFKEHLQS